MTNSLSPLPVQKFFTSNGDPAVGGKVFTYLAGTTTKTSTWKDSGGVSLNTNPIVLDYRGECLLWLDPTITYKLVLAPSTDTDPPTNPIWTVDNVRGPLDLATLTQALIGTIFYPQSSAEAAALVTPTNYYIYYGDLRRYGATPGADVTLPFSKACSQAQQLNGAPVYIPSALGTNCTITAGVTLSRSTVIYGDGHNVSQLTTANDITVITMPEAAALSKIQGFSLIGKGAGATLPAIQLTDCFFNIFADLRIQNFGIGIQFLHGASTNTCYLNTIRDSQIIQNRLINIDAQKFTHVLTLYNVTFGGSLSPTGLKVTDCLGLTVVGFDCEGVSVCGIDIDNPTVANVGGYTIQGGDCEANTASGGVIRLGVSNVNPVFGVNISGVHLSDNNADSFLNIVNAVGVDVSDIFMDSGYAGVGIIDGWLRLGANGKGITVRNFTNASQSIHAALQVFQGTVAMPQQPLTGAAPVIVNGTTINTKGFVVQRVAPGAAVTGIILQAGFKPGQLLTVINESAAVNTVTFAAAGTSNVADGVGAVIAGLTQKTFVWDSITSLWYHS